MIDTGSGHGASPLFMAGHYTIYGSLIAAARTVKIILKYNFIITPFDCQGDRQGGGISARANVAPPLHIGLLSFVQNATSVAASTHRATKPKRNEFCIGLCRPIAYYS